MAENPKSTEEIKGVREVIREEARGVRGEVQEKTLGYILTALGLVAGLAWNDAVKATIESVFPAGEGSIVVKFIYAIAITLAIVVLSAYLTKLFKKKDGG